MILVVDEISMCHFQLLGCLLTWPVVVWLWMILPELLKVVVYSNLTKSTPIASIQKLCIALPRTLYFR